MFVDGKRGGEGERERENDSGSGDGICVKAAEAAVISEYSHSC